MNTTSTTPGDLGMLAAWAPELADTFVALSSDIALVLDHDGRIVKVAQRPGCPIAQQGWIGQPWATTVVTDSRAKTEQMLAEVASCGEARRRELNHHSAAGGPATVAYRAVRLGQRGPILAVGQDLRADIALQQRFVAAQEALERSYWNAQSRMLAPAAPSEDLPRMTARERASLGLDSGSAEDHAEDARLLHALEALHERIGLDALPGLLRDAGRAAERHFLQRALVRAGSVDTLANWLGVSPRALARRGGAPLRASARRKPRGAA